jgi:hypothetical protein
MSYLGMADKQVVEQFLGMSSGYVLNFSDRTFGEFMFETAGVDIHDVKYTTGGTSKANKLRSFFKQESDHVVGKLLLALIDYDASCTYDRKPETAGLAEKIRAIATRFLAGAPSLAPLKEQAKVFNSKYLAEQIRRMEAAVETDPSLAIGTAKELFETCCKTILAERGKLVSGTPDISALSKETFKALQLVPDGIADAARGADIIKRLLSNLGTVGTGIAELRNLYGTGHGKHASASGLSPRHAKLAVGAIATLTTFLFETHLQSKK